jgi:branched-chain amino acid transport system permease protein
LGLKRSRPIAVLLVLVAVVPPLLAALKTPFYMTQLTMCGYYLIVAIGLCLLMGYAGQISLGQAGFFAIGGYLSAFLSKLDLSSAAAGPAAEALKGVGVLAARTDAYGKAVVLLSPWVSCLAAVVLAASVAFLVGIPVLKLKGHYLAMATLGFGVIVEKLARGTKGFGGADGISSVPPFPLLPGLVVSGARPLRAANFYIAWGLVVLCLVLVVNLVNSRAGRALRAIHDGEEAASAMGVDTARYKPPSPGSS